MKEGNALFYMSLLLVLFVWSVTIVGLSVFHSIDKKNHKKSNVAPDTFDTIPLSGTVYSANSRQTLPFIKTASGRLVRNDSNMMQHRIVALSQDIAADYNIRLGDSIWLLSENPLLEGKFIVEDVMHYAMKGRIDYLISRNDLKKFKKGVYSVALLIKH